MNIRELKKYILTLRKRGDPVKGELVELYSKISFPLAIFIIALIGAPLALGIGRGGFFLNFGISIAIAFTYWGVISLGKSLGKGGMLPPFLSAWIANLIFAGLGIYLICKART
jgi:lipopolysaccharide export system permease protein